MKRTSLLLTLILALFATAIAENVELTRAQRVAESLLASKMGQTPNIQLVDYANRGSFSNFYVFGNEHCFVIVSADDRVSPILGYSTEDGFGQTAMPENVFYWLKAYDDEISAVVSHQMEATEEIVSEWSNLMNGNGLEPKSRTSVSPLILTKWDQVAPFNNLCPTDANNVHAVTGCVATAMAQLMNYWEHPTKGTGSHSYNCTGYGQQTVNFGNTTYDWDHMKNSYASNNTNTEITAVATLMYHCGVSVNMAYSANASAANSYDVPNALKTYFGYSTATQCLSQSSYSSQWITMLKTELNNARPVYYCGQSGSVGHAFICDGYNENNQFHFNWGWSGSCDGYYTIGALNPGPGGTGSGDQGQYNSNNAAIFYCEPIAPTINPPTNVSASVNGHNVTLTWTAASGASSYKVYRDGNLVNGSVSGTSYTDSNVTYGIHVYYLKSVSSNGTLSLKSNNATADVHFAGPVPTNLQGSANGTTASLSWTAPAAGPTAPLQYGTGTMAGSYGYNGAADTYWAQRYSVSTLAQYAGMAINKVSVYFRYTGSYTLYIYKGDETGPSELVQQKSYSATATGWKDITLSTPAVLDYSKDLWVVMKAPSSINSPAAYCSYSGTGATDARYLSSNGDSWQEVNSNISWLFKTYLTDGTRTYRVYRNNTAIATSVSSTSYTDSNLSNGTYNYYVTTNYYGGESDASNSVSVVVDGSQTYTITVSADPTTGGNVTGGGTYSSGTSCTVTATPNTGYNFVNWTENGQQVSTSASYTFNVTGNRNLVAHFQLQTYTISVSANPTAGGNVGGGGTYTQGQSCTVTASANTGYTFVNWTENGQQVSTNANYTFNVTGNRTLVANFTQQTYTISVSANPTAGGSVSGGGTYTQGQSCTVTASANTGYTFVNWTENGQQVSTNANYTFNVTGNRTLVANFTQQNYTISVSANPTAGGSVTGGGSNFHYNDNCTVTATPNTGYTFVNWTENGQQVSTSASYSFNVTGNRTLVANFSAQSYTISVSANPTAGGSVSGGGTYNHGQNCTVVATPNSGYSFVNWTENGQQVSTNASYSFNVTGNRTLVANFTQQTYTVNVSANPTAGGSVSGGGTYNHGQNCTVVATPNSGYTFVNWTENGQQVSTNASYTFSVTSNRNLVAHFSTQSYIITATADPVAGGNVSGSGGYNYGDQCTLTATANAGYDFINWTKNGTQVSNNATFSFTVTESATYVAHFQVRSYDVTVAAQPEESGSVSGGGHFDHGQSCTVHATPNTGYNFVNWTENGTPVSTSADYTFTVEGNRNLVAVFGLGSFVITAVTDPENGGSITGTGSYEYGESCIISIEPYENYTFVNWTENGEEVSAEPSFDFIVEGSRSFVAHLLFYDGINEIDTQVELYPNPVEDWLHIEGAGIRKVVVVNAMGQMIESMETEGQEMLMLNVKHYEPAAYIMMLYTEKGIVTRRFVKK